MIKYLKMEFSFEKKEDVEEDIGFEEDLLEDRDLDDEDMQEFE
jgi:hypothetical protein